MFDILVNDEMLSEYAELLIRKNVDPQVTRDAIELFVRKAIHVEGTTQLSKYHPTDLDDTCFVICAMLGDASHIVSSDKHLTALAGHYSDEFRICHLGQFIGELNERIKELIDECVAQNVLEVNKALLRYVDYIPKFRLSPFALISSV